MLDTNPDEDSTDMPIPRQAKWLRKQRRKLRNGTLRPERRAYLDEHMPGWDSVDLDRILGI
ncbi:MAG: hypothetical protein ACK5MR_16645 [Cumulibacter sp.]